MKIRWTCFAFCIQPTYQNIYLDKFITFELKDVCKLYKIYESTMKQIFLTFPFLQATWLFYVDNICY